VKSEIMPTRYAERHPGDTAGIQSAAAEQ